MTDAEWKQCIDPEPMLEFLRGRASERKLRLFAVACCRRVWDLMTEQTHRDTVEAAERHVDGLMTEEEFEEVMQPVAALWGQRLNATQVQCELSHYMNAAARHLGTGGGALYAADFAARGLACRAGKEGEPAYLASLAAEEAAQCNLLRDVFGDPSFPFRFDPAWLCGQGGPAVERARAIYREGRFDDLPSLADLLERSGCRDPAVLAHCRGPGPHTRGCWVVDALLAHEAAVRTGLLSEADWQACADPEPLLHFLRNRGSQRKWRLFAVACCRRIAHLIADERSRVAVEVAARHADGSTTEEELEAARRAAQFACEEAWNAEYAAEAEANFLITPEYAAVSCRAYAASAACNAARLELRMENAEPASLRDGEWAPTWTWAAEAVRANGWAASGSRQDDARWSQASEAANAAWEAEREAQCGLLRDLFGEHLGPPGEEGRWLPCWLYSGPQPPRGDEQWCLLPTPRGSALHPAWLAWNGGTVPRLAEAIYREEAFDRLPILADALEEAGCTDAGLLGHLRGSGPHVRGCFVLDLLTGRE
jgi:hypothetical protein